MAKFLSDIVDYLFEQQQVGFNAIDTTALDALILEFIETPQNGYMTETEEEWDDDSTSYITVVVDSTAASITVLEWKELYLEEVYNQSFIKNNQIAIRDHNSPNYALINFRDTLFDFDASSSINYVFDSTADSTADVFIEYEYPTAEKVDGMYLQGGNDGEGTYDTLTSCVIAYYIGYSNDKTNWSYLKSPVTSIEDGYSASFATDEQDAIDNPFLYSETTPINSNKVQNVGFSKAIEAKYWRLFIIDLKAALTILGLQSGYTGYTAAISHLRFQQYKEHGTLLFDTTLERVKTKGIFSSGVNGNVSSNSGAAWFTSLIITTTNYGVKEISTHASFRIYSDSTAEFRIQFQNDPGAGWITVDVWEVIDGMGMLIDSRHALNPNSDLDSAWLVKYRLQDRAPVGAPSIDFRYSHLATFRSSDET